MKTTIDIPDALHKRAKIRAVERGQPLKDLVVSALMKELEPPSNAPLPGRSIREKRILRPEFQRLMDAGALGQGTDSAIMVSEDRTSREDALL